MVNNMQVFPWQDANGGSQIREIWEIASRFRHEGKNPIDLTLGNPNVPPPESFYGAMKVAIERDLISLQEGLNPSAYIPNLGLDSARERASADLRQAFNLPFGLEHVIMTPGATGALNLAFNSLLSGRIAQDEVIIIAPYFPIYPKIVDIHGGNPVIVPKDPDLSFPLEKIARALTPKTRSILLCSPNNPDGRIICTEEMKRLTSILEDHSSDYGIVVVEDSPYSRIIPDDAICPSMLDHYSNTLRIEAITKQLGAASERLGILMYHPGFGKGPKDRSMLTAKLTSAMQLMYAGASRMPQEAMTLLGWNRTSELETYRTRVDRLYEALIDTGFEVAYPDGGFYLFPKIPDRYATEEAFREAAWSGNDPLLYVPGEAFGYPGYFRLALCIPDKEVERAIIKVRSL